MILAECFICHKQMAPTEAFRVYEGNLIAHLETCEKEVERLINLLTVGQTWRTLEKSDMSASIISIDGDTVYFAINDGIMTYDTTWSMHKLHFIKQCQYIINRESAIGV